MNKNTADVQTLNPQKQAFRISSIYFLTGFLWILISDILVNINYGDNFAEFFIETGKGILFLVVTSVLLYYLLKRYFTSLQKVNDEQSANETKYRTLAENLEFSLTRHDKNNRYIYVNAAGWEMLRELSPYNSAEEIYGKTPDEIYNDKFLADTVINNNHYVFSTGKTLLRKLHYRDKYYSYSKIPEFDPNGEIISVLSVISDETELMKNLARLEESEKFNSHLVNSSNVIVYIYDLTSRGNVYANKAMERMLGYKVEEIQQMGERFLISNMHPADLQYFGHYIESRIIPLKDGEISEFEYRMMHKDGNYRWFRGHDCIFKRDEQGNPLQILGSAVDITELKKIEEALTLNSEYMKAIIEASPLSIFDLDPEGKVLSIWNKASEEIFGWNSGEIMGKLLPIVPKERIFELQENLKINLESRNINGKEQLRIKKDGSEIAIKIYSRPVTGKNGKIQSILAYNEDITLHNKYEEDLKKNEEYLRLLYEVSLTANSMIDTSELYKASFDFIEKIMKVTGILVSVVGENNRYFRYEAVRVEGADVDTANIPHMLIKPDGKGPITKTILTGKHLIINDLEATIRKPGKTVFIDTGGKICPMDDGETRNVSRSALMIPLKFEGNVIGVLQIQSEKTDFYTEDDIHKLEPIAYIIASVLQRSRFYEKAQHELNEKEKAFEQVRKFSKGIENSPNSIVITNANAEIEYVNPYFTELTGYTLEEVQGKNPNILQSGQTVKGVYEDMWSTLLKGETWQGEFLNLKKSGQLYWESASIGPITDNTGKVTHFIAIKQDITEKKKRDKELKDSLEEKEIMLKEIHHRVKNNLQVISSLLNMQVEQYENPEAIEAINSSRNRVKSMALVHENLYKSHNIAKTSLKEYIVMLAKNIYSSYGVSFERVKFYCDTKAIEFGLDTIIPLGLILNESISNSLKHAFPGEASGHINIMLKELIDENAEKGYKLSIKDDGKGLPEGFDPEKTNSLGMTLLTSLSMQLDGNTIINNKAGTEIVINFKELKYKPRV